VIVAVASERATRASTQIRMRCGWAPPQPRSVSRACRAQKFGLSVLTAEH
jgi:hypothetical protein